MQVSLPGPWTLVTALSLPSGARVLGDAGIRIFGAIFWAAALSSVIGAAYTSATFLSAFSKKLAGGWPREGWSPQSIWQSLSRRIRSKRQGRIFGGQRSVRPADYHRLAGPRTLEPSSWHLAPNSSDCVASMSPCVGRPYGGFWSAQIRGRPRPGFPVSFSGTGKTRKPHDWEAALRRGRGRQQRGEQKASLREIAALKPRDSRGDFRASGRDELR